MTGRWIDDLAAELRDGLDYQPVTVAAWGGAKFWIKPSTLREVSTAIAATADTGKQSISDTVWGSLSRSVYIDDAGEKVPAFEPGDRAKVENELPPAGALELVNAINKINSGKVSTDPKGS